MREGWRAEGGWVGGWMGATPPSASRPPPRHRGGEGRTERPTEAIRRRDWKSKLEPGIGLKEGRQGDSRLRVFLSSCCDNKYPPDLLSSPLFSSLLDRTPLAVRAAANPVSTPLQPSHMLDLRGPFNLPAIALSLATAAPFCRRDSCRRRRVCRTTLSL